MHLTPFLMLYCGRVLIILRLLFFRFFQVPARYLQSDIHFPFSAVVHFVNDVLWFLLSYNKNSREMKMGGAGGAKWRHGDKKKTTEKKTDKFPLCHHQSSQSIILIILVLLNSQRSLRDLTWGSPRPLRAALRRISIRFLWPPFPIPTQPLPKVCEVGIISGGDGGHYPHNLKSSLSRLPSSHLCYHNYLIFLSISLRYTTQKRWKYE